MSMLVFRVKVFMLVRVGNIHRIMFVEFIVPMPVLMHNRHVDVKMGMLFVCEQERACGH